LAGRINLQALAAAAGLELARVTAAAPLNHLTARLLDRAKQGRVTPFEEKEPARRVNPDHLLPGCRSIIVIGLPYPAGPDEPSRADAAGPRGLVARCARGLDYHRIVAQKGESLARLLKKELAAPLRYRVLCDRSPLVERELARLAGLGRIGENCTLITPAHGSFVALGTILLDRLLEEDAPLPGGCTGCGRCRAACPTGALTAPYILDYSRCLAYLTQVSGIVPAAMRPLFEERLYGCDRCQEVCPLNRDPRRAEPLANSALFFPGEPLLLPLLQISRKEFAETIGRSAAGWRGKTTIQRNAVIALGNRGDPAAVPALARLLEADPRPVIRLHSAWALGQIQGRAARQHLENCLQREDDPLVKEEARHALDGE
jgi:epoxyqueuosine reductase